MNESLRLLFWDVDFEALSWEAHRDFIIQRVLERGNLDHLRWLRQTLGDKELADWILARQGRGLSPRQLAFWQIVLDLPMAQVNRWIEHAGQTIWWQKAA